jgi:hypothetical protein
MKNRLSFAFLSLLSLALMVGCGSASKADQPAGESRPEVSASMVPGAGSAQNMEAPKEEKVGEVSMKDLCAASAISVLPGSEGSKGDTFKRGDGGSKHKIQFDTKLSLNDIAEFYKKDGLDPKIEGDKLQSMGMTKNKSMIQVTATKQSTGGAIVQITSLTYPKK